MFGNANQNFIIPEEAAATVDSILVSPSPASASPEWENHELDGQLAVDVVDQGDTLMIIATMAGTKPQNIQLHLHNDFLTIRGRRDSPVPLGSAHFYQECFWGPFSRTIVLPTDVKSELARAEYHSGLLIIYLPKTRPANSIPIMVMDE